MLKIAKSTYQIVHILYVGIRWHGKHHIMIYLENKFKIKKIIIVSRQISPEDAVINQPDNVSISVYIILYYFKSSQILQL